MSLSDEDKQWIAAQFSEKLEATETKFSEKLEAMETKLLRAFHDWASPVEMRMRSHTALMRAMDAEIESLGERVSKLEPPH